MSHFADTRFSHGRSGILALLLTSVFSMQSANGHEYTSLIKAKKYAEVERAVSSKLASNANDADALLARIDLILIETKATRFDEGVKIAEQCIAGNPKNSECHEALGNVLGARAEKGGMMPGISSIGKIRDSYKKAIELDPRNFIAASSLTSFYLEVPGFLGGSNSKAKELILETKKLSPEVAKLLQAKFDLKDGNLDKARTGALSVDASATPAAAQLQPGILVEIGLELIKEKKFSDAEKVFREMIQRYPDSSAAYLGLGRSLQEQGKLKEALPQLEKSLSIDATAAVLYRLGKTWQALGDKTKAIASFEKALAFTPLLGPKARADAEEQLKTLK